MPIPTNPVGSLERPVTSKHGFSGVVRDIAFHHQESAQAERARPFPGQPDV